MNSCGTQIYVSSKSMYDVVVENLESQNKKTYIHRIIYAFEFDDVIGNTILGEKFQGIIEYQNSRYHDERITGILVLYDNVGIHLIEGSDYTLSRHVELLYRDGNLNTWMTNVIVKLLSILFHTTKRLQKEWTWLRVSATYIERIKCEANEEQTNEEDVEEEEEKTPSELYIKCMEMILEKQTGLLQSAKQIAGADSRSLTHGGEATGSDSGDSVSGDSYLSALEEEEVNVHMTVPPTSLLSSLLKTNMLYDLIYFSDRLGSMPKFTPYHESIWPLASSHVPALKDVVLKSEQDTE